jgi:GNAT superfamily N-acetyltransferase
VEVHHAANHAKFGPPGQRTTLANVLAVPGRRHEQWQCLAGSGDKLVGAGAAITTRDNPHVGTMWLSVHPDHQGRGLGGALLAEIERDLRERGCTELLVHATEISDGGGASPHFAIRFLRCHGEARAPGGVRDGSGGDRSHSDAWVGCMVWSTTASRSVVRVSRSTGRAGGHRSPRRSWPRHGGGG